MMKKLFLIFLAATIIFIFLNKIFSPKLEIHTNATIPKDEYVTIQRDEPKMDLWARLSDYEKQLTSAKDRFDGDVHDARGKIKSCYAAGVDVSYASGMAVDSMKKKALEVKKKLINYQIKCFPHFRKAFSQTAKDKLWEHDIEVSVSGAGSKTIIFTAGIFAANKNVKAAYEGIEDQLKEFRFNKACFAWYSGQDDYQYYTIDCLKDSDL